MTRPYEQTMFQLGRAYRRLGRQVGGVYHRIEVQPPIPDVPEPVLFVSHHGWGAAVDPNLFAIWAMLHKLDLSKPYVAIAHGMAWKIGGGSFMEGIGAVPASPEAATDALADGRSVLVLPGGDLEAFKPFSHRDKILFHGRTGFARVAMTADVPIVPLVVAGAGETLLALSDGAGIARRLGLDRRLRLKAFPVSVTLPWGLNVGTVGLTLPYLPLPAKLTGRILEPMKAHEEETVAEFAARVESAMQAALTDMTKDRRFMIG
ncbi:MAG: 1-acyl-sn-glycerol-3-phosphate acyltransferase [Tetrasphaera sp.]